MKRPDYLNEVLLQGPVGFLLSPVIDQDFSPFSSLSFSVRCLGLSHSFLVYKIWAAMAVGVL